MLKFNFFLRWGKTVNERKNECFSVKARTLASRNESEHTAAVAPADKAEKNWVNRVIASMKPRGIYS